MQRSAKLAGLYGVKQATTMNVTCNTIVVVAMANNSPATNGTAPTGSSPFSAPSRDSAARMSTMQLKICMR